jgi:acyl carrier protein
VIDINTFFMEDLAAILEADPEELHEEFSLHSENWNSLSIVSAIVLIDEQFGISIEGEKLRQCATVGALWDLIQKARDGAT